MTEVRQFRTTLYLLLAIGITGFAVAAQTPGLWLLAVAAMTLNVWLIRSGRFEPVPRLVAAGATILALVYTVFDVRGGGTPIIAIGTFLVLLHLVKLYEQRANRDYAQLLILSLLLMAAAAISTASLIFGLLLIAYLFISLYCSLLFHLKVESDTARTLLADTSPMGGEKISPAALQQDQRRISASMRLLTALVSSVSLTMAVLVFLFFPRGAAEGLLGRRMWMMPQVSAGFSEQVSFDQVARINQSDEVVAQVKVTQAGRAWGGTELLLLRGTTVDQYTGNSEGGRWQWKRSNEDYRHDLRFFAEQMNDVSGADVTGDTYLQEITLEPTESHALFAIAGMAQLQPSRELSKMNYFPADAVLLSSGEPLGQGDRLTYKVYSTGELPVVNHASPGTPPAAIDRRLVEYARRPEVSGADDSGRPLSTLIGTLQAPPDAELRIARNIEQHLRSTEFKYTTDLTKLPARDDREDPLVWFLYTTKQGHCEYFAGAMTLLCQSLGLQARMVLGYRCDQFNTVGQFYIVNQSQAHAWVEVLTTQHGKRIWETFDPTSSNEVIAPDSASLFGRLRSIFNYLEYRWGTSVVAYGQQNRKSLMDAIEYSVTRTSVRTFTQASRVPHWLDDLADIISNPTRLSALVMLMVMILIGAVGYYIFDQWRLRRRMNRIGLSRLTSLPASEQRRLARQLGFYNDLLALLERRGVFAAPNLTPLEFSDQLSYLPHQAYHDIRRLTRLYYRIRYGKVELNTHRRRLLESIMQRIGRVVKNERRGPKADD